jgi:regulator of PEP synthase PpsR (kinase-PPPase family)
MNKIRTAFFISDRTGITSESLGHSLLSQFESVKFNRIRLPFLDTVEKARDAVVQINEASAADGQRPLIFSTLILPAVRNIIEQSDALFLQLIPCSGKIPCRRTKLQLTHGCGQFYVKS